MMELKADTTIVVLGASGDLAKKKTVSATGKNIAFPPPLFLNNYFFYLL